MNDVYTLYIIGNGFDRFHGVNSGYDDFAKYLKHTDRELYSVLEVFIDSKKLWGDFEGELANFSRESLIEWIDLSFLPWKDDKDDDFSYADFYAAIDHARGYIDQCTEGMKFRFHKWIRTLGLPKGHKYKKLNLDENAFYINFNYTDFLESFYQIPSNQISYLHGKKSDRVGSIILGHGENPEMNLEKWVHKNEKKKRFRTLQKNSKGKYYPNSRLTYLCYFCEEPKKREWRWPTRYYAIDPLVNCVEDYFTSLYKNFRTVVDNNKPTFERLSNVKRIILMGHSLSAVDLPYFQEIWKCIEDKDAVEWEISCFIEQDLINATRLIALLNLDANKVLMYNLNEKKVYK